MTEAQVIFRVDKKLLARLDASLPPRGFKTRNEWFRHELREFLDASLAEVDIDKIKETARKTLKKHGVKKAALFGSAARGELIKDSDIDILVEFTGRKSLLDLVRIERELSELIGFKVDLLTEKSISPYIRDSVKRDLQVIYDEG
ncbi:nucleotidyltransferase family protein [archaeon]|nr:nucleotidyltransferase family protein [archaeon]